MAAMPRESTFMPTVKCSTCGRQVEISLMGDHLCSGAEAEPAPSVPAPSIFDRFALPLPNPFGGLSSSAPADKQARAPPKVDTSAANRAYMGQQGQLTPVSLSSGSRSVSPKTPVERPGAERTNGYFAPKIANDSPPAQARRPGGYGGYNDDGFDDPLYPASAPKKQAPNLLERMNTIAPGPFDTGRRPSLARGGSNDSTSDRPGTSASNLSSSFDSLKAAPKMPRKNGYGGFGPPPKAQEDERFVTPNRSETFPRPSEAVEPPMRTPSAPGSRPERLRRPSASQERPPLTSERSRRPSRGPDTSRPPPPRISTIPTPTVPSINLAAEFGIGNPYHTPSVSTSSSSSSFSQRRPSQSSSERRPSQASSERRPSQASSRSSPPRSVASRTGRNPSDTSGFDSLMADLQTSMTAPKPLPLSPLQPPPVDKGGVRGLPPLRRPPPPERGYDPRIDPRGRQPVSPLSPNFDAAFRDDFGSLSTSAPSLSPDFRAPPSPRWASPDRSRDRSRSGPREPERMRSQSRPREAQSMRSQSRSREPERMRSQSRPRDTERARSQSRPRGGLTVPSSRGDCKACRLPITGKSISSADGRLTGRYHKACFVCADCKEPFSSSTFYVLDDRPYCEMDYHKLNGSVCGSCSRGIEGQYLEDESAKKHHVGCFRCGDCGMALKDGYFEVNGMAFCEKDAWRRVQPPPMANGMKGGPGSARRGPSNLNPGLPGGPRLAGGFGLPPGNRLGLPGPRPKMEKRMTRLGMM